ncbi:MAG TPA: flavocytochrome c [Candidatus Sutterella merdavium]|nr:flavocytochrome c [Candidatus Sutterella merdavium]
MQISRRNLLSGAVAASVGSVALSAKAADLCSLPQKWDQTWEVIVIGAGGAGLAAGITAKELGAKTIVLEKMAFPGGNTMVSGGGMNAAVEADYKAAGVEDSPKLHAEQTLAAGDNRADPALVEILAKGAPESVEWLKKIGVKFRPGIYQIYGGLWPRCRNPEGQSGSDYIKAGTAYAKKIGLEILPGHKVTSIIREKPNAGRVLGVEVEVGGKKQYWRATRGVIAASGGYAANAEMCGFFDPRLTKLNTTNQPCSTGEVLRAIQDVNGLAVGMDYIQCIPWTAPGYTSTADVFQAIEYTIFVNKEGKRYVAEDNRRDVIRDATLAQTDQTVFQLCDTDGYEEHKKFYYEMNEAALKNGVLFRCNTIEEAAAKVKIPAAELKKTVEEFNAEVDSKKDPFGRTPKMLVRKIVKAPFYIGPFGMCRHHTMGGARIDTKARVLDREGKVIPGLYAAGEVTGGIHGTNRVGGNAIADIFTFGRIAGESAAKA